MKLKVGFSEKRNWLWFVEVSVTPQTNCSGLDYFTPVGTRDLSKLFGYQQYTIIY